MKVPNRFLHEICKLNLNGTEFKVIILVMMNTNIQDRLSCELSHTYIAQELNISVDGAKKATKSLRRRKILVRTNPNENGFTQKLAINYDYESWAKEE